jgi:hypothetical protein
MHLSLNKKDTLTAIKGIIRMLAYALNVKVGRRYLLRLRNGRKVRKLLKNINTPTSQKLREIFSDSEVSYLFILLVPLIREMPFPAMNYDKKGNEI